LTLGCSGADRILPVLRSVHRRTPTEDSLRPLDALNARVMQYPAAARLTLMSRILLAVAFIPTGSVKLMGERFTSLGMDTSVGAFFEAMYQTGAY
jgi:hypothetical protein